MMRMIVVLVWMANIVSCWVFRTWWNGRMWILVRNTNRFEGVFRFYFAGMLNQPWQAFHKIVDLADKKSNTVLFKYSAFGWSPKTAAKQLDEFCDAQDRILVGIVYAISVGEKVMRYLPVVRMMEYAINPCPDPGMLKPKLQKRLPAVAIILEILSIMFGWIAMLPLIPTEASPYSLTLLADQVWQIAITRRKDRQLYSADGLIISSQDEFLDNKALKDYFYGADVEEIDTMHGRTGDEKSCLAYREALERLEVEVGTTPRGISFRRTDTMYR